MFTGIIEETGVITSLILASENAKLIVAAPRLFTTLKIGDSVAINGVCLTIVNLRLRSNIEFDISSETLKKSTLRDLRIGDKVNLERALTLATRLNGHLVTGHVDGVGEVREKIAQGKGFELHISLPSDLLPYLVSKGSIAIDGISLTIADLRDGLLIAAVIPHTAAATTLNEIKVGDRVNLEVDILSKYIERHLMREFAPPPPAMSQDPMIKLGFLPMGWMDN
ncbi:MAG: riboflavin synthase [Candidatus Margulisbacteria bacterium]|nr:riboflavin synthase [Candidatus Margulisiibacteriota bacterium]